MSEINTEIKKLAEYRKVRKSISSARIGIIGKTSDWLIGSKVDYEHAGQHWGTQFIDIKMEEFYNLYGEIENKKAERKADQVTAAAEKMVENSREDLIEAVKIYYALKKIVNNYNLDALTLRCFDIVEKLNNTGCLALALLNNE